MRRQLLTVVALVVVSASCSGSNDTCTTCPPVEGSWAMSYAAPPTACPFARQPPATLPITRVGSIVRATVDDTQLSGTAYDTFEFTLRGDFGELPPDSGTRGDGGSRLDRAELRAVFIPKSTDGGTDRLTGTWTFTPAFTTCVETREFNGARQ